MSKRAEKQFSLEKKLEETFVKFKDIQIEVAPYKQTQTLIMKNYEELLDSLNEQITLIIMIKSSPWVKDLIRRVNDLEKKITDTIEFLEEILKC